jgi:UDP-N-acetylmuramoyl-tripeptide--D-alanyl-D-alanine ligase
MDTTGVEQQVIPLKVSEIATACGGKITYGDPDMIVTSVSTDSRKMLDGELFIPLVGDEFDGHDFIGSAVQKGATGWLTSKSPDSLKYKPRLEIDKYIVIEVDDTLKAYQDLAAAVRNRFTAKVIAITGSTGKTSTKDMMSVILSKTMKTSASPKNYNNEVGVPYTILNAPVDVQALILEMAMRGKGQIKELAEIGKPDIGVITNIGVTHFELLGSEDRIVEAKAELVDAMDSKGVCVTNKDDEQAYMIGKKARGRVVTYGLGESCDVRATGLRVEEAGTASFDIISQLDGATGKIRISLNIPGRYNVYNALAAAAVALLLGLSFDIIKKGLESASVSALRMEVIRTDDNFTIINDTYNASPASMRAALETLRDMAGGSRSIAVLGDMFELGGISKRCHIDVGRYVADLKIDKLMTIGERARDIAEGARGEGMPDEDIAMFASIEEAGNAARNILRNGDHVLVKGSRAMGLERLVERIA